MLYSKNHFLCLFFLLAFSLCSSAQECHLTGVVKDSTHTISYANVVLTNNIGEIIAGTVTKEDGSFNLSTQPGKLKLTISFIGYHKWTKEIEVSSDTNLGTIILNPQDNKLKEIVSTTTKPLIEHKIDRLVFNVENSIVANGVDALEVIKSTPKIDVTKSGINLIGKSSVIVLVNDRRIQLTGTDLENYLRSIRSERIKKIEVITIPPSKYDAEGNSGVLNIVLKKRLTNSGFSGSTTLSYGQSYYSSYSPSCNINYSKNKFSLNFNFSDYLEKTRPVANSTIEYTSSLRKMESERIDESKGLSTGLGITYDINSKTTIGLTYDGSFDITKENSRNSLLYYKNNTFDSIQYSPSYIKYDYNFHTISAYFDIKLDTLGKKITFNTNYLLKNNINKQNLQSKTYTDIEQQNVINSSSSNNNTNADYNIFITDVDVVLPLDILSINFGSKYTLSNNNFKNKYYDTSSGSSILNENLSDNFKYQEQIFALYFSANKKFGDFWTAQFGLRYEYTLNESRSISLSETSKKNFDNLFPTFFLNFVPNEDHSFSFAYSKRIERPGFYDLNPFRIYSNTNSYESGNSNLNPSLSNNFEISYILKNNLYLTLNYTYLKDAFDYVTITNENSDEIISSPENYYNQNTIGFDCGYNYKPFQWLNSYNTASFYYNKSKSYLTDLTESLSKGADLYFATRNTITLNQSKSWYLMINYFQEFPNTEGFIKAYTRAKFDIGLRTKLINKKLVISGYISDLFKQYRNNTLEVYPNFKYKTQIYNDIRNFHISLSYMFGSNTKKTKKIYIEEKDRL